MTLTLRLPVRAAVVLVALTATFLVISSSQDLPRYFYYRPLPYGSEAMYHPIGVILNGGLDVMQSYASSTHFNAIPWDLGATSVWRSITSPGYYISRYGWSKFLSHEVFPTSLKIENAQWAPNYTLHAIGGGMEYRKLSEWYDAHGFPAPYVFGAASAMTYHFFNETVENGPGIHPNTDCIADLLIFDPLGIILFSFDDIAEYFSTTWELNDWSPQPSVSLGPPSFRNFSHSFVAKLRLTSSGGTKLFLYLGKSTLLGLTLTDTQKESLSFGAGATQTGVWEVDASNGIPTNTIHVGATAGIFYDRNNSLLASLLVSEYYLERVRVNVFPGVIGSGTWSPGFFVTLGSRGTFAAGITVQMVPVGLAFYAPR
jgi:hypothetical protein